MNGYNEYIPLIVALISAFMVVVGYALQKKKDREFEMDKTRKEIYIRLIKNLVEKLELFNRIKKNENIQRATIEDVDSFQNLIENKYPELDRNFKEFREIMTLMGIYASDEAINACVAFLRDAGLSLQRDSTVRPDSGELILKRRKSLLPRTKVNSQDINFIMRS